MPAFMEPFRIKAVEPIPFPDEQQRRDTLIAAGYNLFRVPASQITIDLLTDSGTSAMSAAQWSALMTGDESYAGARSFEQFEAVMQELTGYPEIIPAHQGRAAERILLGSVLGPGDVSLANTHFDTTRASVESIGATAVDLPVTADPDTPFGGDIDLAALKEFLDAPHGTNVRCVVMTVTNNATGGQPVSLTNLTAVRRLCDEHGIRFLLDASRFAENAYLLTQRDPECQALTPRQAAQTIFSLADGCWASLKKDGVANIGGVIALHDAEIARRCRDRLIETEGFPTYGGLAGRDLAALAQGLTEVTDPQYLRYREQTARWFGDQLEDAGFPVVRPTGCHAVYIDAARLLPHLCPQRLPATALANQLYLAGAVRVSELGTLVFGIPGSNGEPDRPAPRELVRLALPRRVYTKSHLEYVTDVAARIAESPDEVPGYRITEQASTLRHFTAVLEPITSGR
ncbi:tryptophanase [Actinobacteria bacterium YIM 96077]|uniref:Tyrosine phenol-lyase n=1 Tax=Phytoactinopolyspora halophila TaxID=1981511 RepID=A0A329QE37_9ACTN|nr:tryptophanase [Phytoactinopolyspora halophila]AYY13611.1 tryptophanase [Actinobacteria bacterium YIM 96077]RAW10723.1 tyrosine phenol-lyase [Phytoactinopolyspora halophila]